MHCALLRLWVKRPAATSRTSETAACRTTSARCNHEAPCAVVRGVERSASAASVRAAIHAGATPKRMPVTSDSPKANAITAGEGEDAKGIGGRLGKGTRAHNGAPHDGRPDAH